MLDTKFTLHIYDRDALLSLMHEKFDDEGNVIGEKTEAEMAAERKMLTGKLFTRCLITDASKEQHLAFHGPIYDPADKDSRRLTYRMFGDTLSQVIRRRLWSDDTLRTKPVKTAHGTKHEADGYPGDDEPK